MRLGEVAFDPSMRSFSQFMRGDGRKETSRRPPFTTGLFGKLRPQRFDRRQPQVMSMMPGRASSMVLWTFFMRPLPHKQTPGLHSY